MTIEKSETLDGRALLLPKYQNTAVSLESTHYKVDGQRHTRVSTILNIINKPGLVNWAKNNTVAAIGDILRSTGMREAMAEATNLELTTEAEYNAFISCITDEVAAATNGGRDTAANRGTAVHHEIARLLRGADTEDEIRISDEADAALQFIADFGLKLLVVEMPLWSPDVPVAGTCDAIAHDKDGNLVLWDWKTGSGPYWEMAVQLGAYASMFRQLTGLPIEVAYIVKLGETGYVAHRATNLTMAGMMFNFAMELHKGSKVEWFEQIQEVSVW